MTANVLWPFHLLAHREEVAQITPFQPDSHCVFPHIRADAKGKASLGAISFCSHDVNLVHNLYTWGNSRSVFQATCWSVRAQTVRGLLCKHLMSLFQCHEHADGVFLEPPFFPRCVGALCVLFVWQVFPKENKNNPRNPSWLWSWFQRHWVCLLEGVQSSPGGWGAIRWLREGHIQHLSPKEWPQLKTLGGGSLLFSFRNTGNTETLLPLHLFSESPPRLHISRHSYSLLPLSHQQITGTFN